MAEEKEKTTSAIFKEERERILCIPFKDNAKVYKNFKEQANTVEVIDIVNDYPWILDKVQGSGQNVIFSSFISDSEGSGGFKAVGSYNVNDKTARSPFMKKTNVPSCYIVERKNAVNGSITTMLGLLGALDQIAGGIKSIGDDIKGALGKGLMGGAVGALTDVTGDVVYGFKKILAKIVGKLFSQIGTLQADNNLNDELLNPYRFLYFTQDTKKRYVFPLLNADASSFLPTKLQWEKAKIEAPGFVGKIVSSVVDMFSEGAKFTTMLSNGSQLMNENGGVEDIGSVSEAARTFKYPETGDALKINFTLYNTTRKNAWKENYRFLYLFAVRNLPFRLEAFSFLPPLLYDIIVPGIKRMPVCALSQMKVTPVGTTRVLSRDNFLTTSKENATIQVIVPEAWQVELNFQSLIAPSANLLLSMFVGPLHIKSAGDIGEIKVSALEKEHASKEVTNTSEADLLAKCKQIKDSEGREIAWKQLEIVQAVGASEALIAHANDAWNTYSSSEDELKNIKMILATFGETAKEDANGKVSRESIIRAADLLIEYGYAKPNPEWKNTADYKPWDKILRNARGGGILDTSGTKPKMLNPKQRSNMFNYGANNGFEDYKSYDGALKKHTKLGSKTMNKAENSDSISNDFTSYIKPDGSKISQKDVSWLYNPKDGEQSEDTTMYYYNIKSQPPEEHLTPEEREEVRAEIAKYNSMLDILDEGNKQEGGTATKKSPICPEIFPKEEVTQKKKEETPKQ